MGLISRVSSRTYRKMQIFVNTHEGTQAVEATTVGQIMAQFPNGLLLSNGLLLNEADASLEDLGIIAESTIQIVHPVLEVVERERRRSTLHQRRSSISAPRSS